MQRLVDRFGRTGFAALTSVVWALPMAAWAGSADLSPIDRTPFPSIALATGLVLLAVWLGMLTRLDRIKISDKPHRLEVRQMSSAERRWLLGFCAFATGVIAWVSAAATVDWTLLIGAIKAGKPAPTLLAIGAVVALATMLAGAGVCWHNAARAFAERAKPSSLSNNVC